MNKDRRKSIEEAVSGLEEIRDAIIAAKDEIEGEDTPSAELLARILTDLGNHSLDEPKSALECARDEEQEYYDNMHENFQNGDKGSTAQEAIDNLDSAVNALEEVDFSTTEKDADGITSHLEELEGHLDEAIDYANNAAGA